MCRNPREEAFADQVSQYFVNFARTGDPNGPGLPAWPGVKDLGPDETMILDADGSGKGRWIGAAKDRLYTAIYQARVAAPLAV